MTPFLAISRLVLVALFLAVPLSESNAKQSDPESSSSLNQYAKPWSTGQRLGIVSNTHNALTIYDTAGISKHGLKEIRKIKFSKGQPVAFAKDASLAAGISNITGDNKYEIETVDVATGKKASSINLELDGPPENLWLHPQGTFMGVYAAGNFAVYKLSSDGATKDRVPAFSKKAVTFLPAPSGKYLFFTDDVGHLSIVQTDTWRELNDAQMIIETSVMQWMKDSGMRKRVDATSGAFAFPVAVADVTKDNRLVAIFLGESANSYVTVCMSSGKVLSNVVFEKRTNSFGTFSATGNLFTVNLSPNTDDPKFQRPLSDFGFHFYDPYSGKLVAKLPLSNHVITRYRKIGSKYFLDEWDSWFGFTENDSSLITVNKYSKKPESKPIPKAALTGPASSSVKCDPL